MLVQTEPHKSAPALDGREPMCDPTSPPLSACGFEVLRALVLGLPLRGRGEVWAFGEAATDPAAGSVALPVIDELLDRGLVSITVQITERGRVALRRAHEQSLADVAAWLTTEVSLV